MTDRDDPAAAAWFAGDGETGLADAVRDGRAPAPADWPALAVETGFADDEADYEAALRDATLTAARETVRERERADDRQLIHAVRAADDARRTANELVERVAEWGGSLFGLDDTAGDGGDGGDDGADDTDAGADADTDAGTGDAGDGGDDGTDDTHADASDGGVAYARRLADREPDGPAEARAVSLAERAVGLHEEAERLEAYVADHAPAVAPNLAALAGPTLAARLLSLAGGLESLAKEPSGTVQVLGAEDALFAHLRGEAPSPKHGVIYTHDYVRNTHPAERGSAARALAGKLTIAARIDHYSGDRRPELAAELDERIRTIRARRGGDGE